MSDWHPSRTMISCTNNLLFLRLHVIYLNHWSRSSPFQMFFKISVKFLGKYPCGKLFLWKVEGGLRLHWKKRLWHTCILVNFAKSLTLVLKNLQWPLLSIPNPLVVVKVQLVHQIYSIIVFGLYNLTIRALFHEMGAFQELPPEGLKYSSSSSKYLSF